MDGITRNPNFVVHNRCWCCAVAEERAIFPNPLSFTIPETINDDDGGGDDNEFGKQLQRSKIPVSVACNDEQSNLHNAKTSSTKLFY